MTQEKDNDKAVRRRGMNKGGGQKVSIERVVNVGQLLLRPAEVY